MSDQPTEAPIARAAKVNVSSPQPHPIGHFNIAVSTGEVMLTLGQARAVFQPDNPNEPAMGIEWLFSATMSPITAKDLHRILGELIRDYEKQFGAILDLTKVTLPQPGQK